MGGVREEDWCVVVVVEDEKECVWSGRVTSDVVGVLVELVVWVGGVGGEMGFCLVGWYRVVGWVVQRCEAEVRCRLNCWCVLGVVVREVMRWVCRGRTCG